MGSGVTKCCVVGVATLAAATRAAPTHRRRRGRAHRGRRRARSVVRPVRARRGGDRDAPLRGVRAALERRRSRRRPPRRPTQPPVATRRGRRSADQDPLGPNRHARSRHGRSACRPRGWRPGAWPGSQVSTTTADGPATSSASTSMVPPRGAVTRSIRDGPGPVDAAGVIGVRLHDLRHWQATQLLDAGVPVPTVAARLGHADGTTTMKIYAHRTVRGDEMAAEVVGAALGATARGSS